MGTCWHRFPLAGCFPRREMSVDGRSTLLTGLLWTAVLLGYLGMSRRSQASQ